jgi:hypothetical protein
MLNIGRAAVSFSAGWGKVLMAEDTKPFTYNLL